jgi:Fungal specific transcription factor domain
VSPRMTPPGPTRGHLLDVPNSFGQLGHYMDMESVGTPALSTYIKPLAQQFPASAPRIPYSGLASATRRPKDMLLELFTIDTVTMSSYGAKPQIDVYLSSYWQCFHPLFPIIHRPTFEHVEDDLLRTAMAAIGTQYHNTPEARAKGSELNEACKKGIDLVSPHFLTPFRFLSLSTPPSFQHRQGLRCPYHSSVQIPEPSD